MSEWNSSIINNTKISKKNIGFLLSDNDSSKKKNFGRNINISLAFFYMRVKNRF